MNKDDGDLVFLNIHLVLFDLRTRSETTQVTSISTYVHPLNGTVILCTVLVVTTGGDKMF